MFLHEVLQLGEVSLAIILLGLEQVLPVIGEHLDEKFSYLDSILVNIERGEAVHSVGVAEFFIDVVSGRAVHMTDRDTVHS